jgi:hypothetical protein
MRQAAARHLASFGFFPADKNVSESESSAHKNLITNFAAQASSMRA